MSKGLKIIALMFEIIINGINNTINTPVKKLLPVLSSINLADCIRKTLKFRLFTIQKFPKECF